MPLVIFAARCGDNVPVGTVPFYSNKLEKNGMTIAISRPVMCTIDGDAATQAGRSHFSWIRGIRA
jgi:hypothetical protein